MGSLFLLTQNTNALLRPIARVLGWIMNGIYVLFDNLFHVQNIALTIVVFTIVAYVIMLPLTYQQQKFSKMSQVMQPELQAIQKKYRNKKDTVSMQMQQTETQELYRKYGVRPSGSCVFMIIQFLILIPLYRVIYNVPAYVTRVKDTFSGVVDSIMHVSDYQGTMQTFLDTISENNSVLRGITLNFEGSVEDAANSIIDVLYKCTSDNWTLLANTFTDIPRNIITSAQSTIEGMNSFLGVSIVYSPIGLIRTSMSEAHYWMIIIAILIPVISAATQFLSVRLMPQGNTNGQGDQMGNSMRFMTYLMPLYSFFIVFFLPIGIGIYWIAGAVIRIVQQFFINRHFNKIDMKALVDKNAEKAAAKRKAKAERKGVSGEQIHSAAQINARQIPRSMSERAATVAKINAESEGKGSSAKNKGSSSKGQSSSKAKNVPAKNTKNIKGDEAASDKPKVTYKEGSMASLANRVSDYNAKNSKNAKSTKNSKDMKKDSAQTSETKEKADAKEPESSKDTMAKKLMNDVSVKK